MFLSPAPTAMPAPMLIVFRQRVANSRQLPVRTTMRVQRKYAIHRQVANTRTSFVTTLMPALPMPATR